MPVNVERILVLGSGIMGAGIAQVAAQSGFETTLYDVDAAILAKARAKMLDSVGRAVGKGKLPAGTQEQVDRRLRTTLDLDGAAREAQFVIEAVPEKLDLKRDLFTRIEKNTGPEVVLGTNTSSLMISEIAAPLRDPGRLIGMHFFNPVPVMRLVEIILGPKTSAAAVEATEAVSKRMGKETVRVKESPGFTTSRINALIGNEAFRMLEAGIASAQDIDKALKLGLNHPMGPFEMVDLVGLDTRLSTLRYLHKTLGETYRPSPMIEKLVSENRLGKKTGRGVYRYDAEGNRVPD
jgi:3-hydroxybutyryl-CoA dehydrogenase